MRRRRNGSFRPSISTLNHWFSKSAIEELSAIREVVEQYLDKPELYRFLLVCFISVIRRASHADNQTQKTYVSHTKIKKPPSARTLFLDCLDDYTERVLNFSRNVPKGGRGIILPFGDSRNLSLLWNKYHFPKVDLVITSPPYVKSVDYIYNQMAEYFWIGDLFDLDTQRKQNTYKRNYIGTQKLSHPEYKTLPTTGIVSVDTVARKVFKKNRKNGVIVTRFFIDMRSHFEQLTKILQPDASVVFVVGDSLVSGEPIEVHRLIQDCAASSGFAIDNIFGYEIRNRHMRFPRNGRGGIVRYDWVVDLRWKGANG